MAFLKRRSRLELAALVVLVATVAASVTVAFGLLHQRPATSAARLTALCAPLSTAIEHDDPADMTVSDMYRLRGETQRIADGLGEVIMDAERPVRRQLQALRETLYRASDRDGPAPIAVRAAELQAVERRARALGASCPAPLTPAEGRVVDQTLGPRS